MRSIRQGRKNIRKNMRKLSRAHNPGQLGMPDPNDKPISQSSSRKLSARARIPSVTGEDKELSVVIHITEHQQKKEKEMMELTDESDEDIQDKCVFYKDDENRFNQR